MILTWSYSCLIAALAVMPLLSIRALWRRRSFLLVVVLAAAALEIIACTLLLLNAFNAASIATAIIGLPILFNLARIAAQRLSDEYLYHSTLQAGSWLTIMQAATGFSVVYMWSGYVTTYTWTVILAIAQLAVAVVIALSARRQLSKTRLPQAMPDISDGKLPTITVAVPVRNEGGQLEGCLTSILASNYPKLEILAFDDDSHDRTPEIIRSFAHAGVRFLRADKPQSGWLDKNRAYAELAANASGEYILFCGADIRLGVRSLRNLAALLQNRNKSMIAILPQNKLVGHVPLLQAMRYYWEMAPPRRLFRRPPVLSSCWIIKRATLQKAGGFEAVKQSMSPEAHLARYSADHTDGYGFVRSDERLCITSEKPVAEQRSTALYRRYPQLHRRPELVALVSIGQALLLIGPAVLVVAAVMLESVPDYIVIIAGTAFVLHCVAFGAIQKAAFPSVSIVAASLAMLGSVATDIAYVNRSMYRYEFGDVTWKSRNISSHIMRRT